MEEDNRGTDLGNVIRIDDERVRGIPPAKAALFWSDGYRVKGLRRVLHDDASVSVASTSSARTPVLTEIYIRQYRW